MRFAHPASTIPEINLIPMLNVMMGILAFFVMITMTLSKQKSLEVQLPQEAGGQSEIKLSDLKNQFVVDLDGKGQASRDKQPIATQALQAKIRQYLQANPKGNVFLKPDPKLSYEKMMHKLDLMRAAGGDRVSLIIE
ncbi:biopolymer transporter ExbD [Acaryochloris sp. IP29b_bin.137]|uniref:ExbD/TolR family protein n=1 Tax=Acaryochloris sp. IP29b_bin.137 TaxID=2969217 RepID=UPI00262FC4FF|nr:biopolymer transporter ExbD [Acaryochloris sp. IP29b_bin.137]